MPLGLGRGAQPTEVAQALKSLGQDMLQEPMKETLGRQPHCAESAALAVAVVEGDALAVVAEDTLGTEGGAIDVSGEVLQRRLAPADRLDIGDPIQGPHVAGNLDKELGMAVKCV